MIREAKALLDRNPDLEEKDLQEPAYRLLAAQFLYRANTRHRPHYTTVTRFPEYFSALMDAVGYQLVVNEERGYVGILPQDLFYRRMSLDETLMLLYLRYQYDEGFHDHSINEDATLDVPLEVVKTHYQRLTHRQLPPKKQDFLALIDPFLRSGLVQFFRPEDSEEEHLRIHPSIADLITGDSLRIMEAYLRAEDVDTSESSAESEESAV